MLSATLARELGQGLVREQVRALLDELVVQLRFEMALIQLRDARIGSQVAQDKIFPTVRALRVLDRAGDQLHVEKPLHAAGRSKALEQACREGSCVRKAAPQSGPTWMYTKRGWPRISLNYSDRHPW